MQFGLISQIGLLILSGIIAFTYVRPTLAEIGDLQDDLYSYNEAVERAEEFNQLINSLVQEIESIPARDRAALQIYMPSSIDSLQVISDIQAMAARSNLLLDSAEGADGDEVSEVTASEVVNNTGASVPDDANGSQSMLRQQQYQDFTMSLIGDYQRFVDFLNRVEQNAYPLDVVGMSFGAPSESLMTFDVTLRAYALNQTSE